MFALVSLAAAALYQAHEEKAFLFWMRSTNHLYTGDEYQARLGIYLTNSRLVQEHNAKGMFRVSLNKFAAMTPSEYLALLGFKPVPRQRKAVESGFQKAGSLDWREKGAVNDVKDQGQCGSCWAFSTIAGAEGANFISSGRLQSFSESNLVDCVYSCFGCNGGLMTSAFDYVIDNQGGKFMLEDDYPYKAVQDSCKFDKSKAVGSVKMYIEIIQGNEDDLAKKCAQYGPVCVAIDASQWSFQLYSGGIYDEPSCSSYNLDHGVACVGYGSEGSQDYWIVRNSWGASWGESGYIRMIWKDNQCGIATMACVPIA